MSLLNIQPGVKVKFASNSKVKFVTSAYGYGGGGGGGGLSSGLQAFYRLSDLTDASGNGNTLTNVGGVTFGSGRIGNAAVFDGGTSQNLTTPINGKYASGFSTSMWFRKTGDKSTSSIIQSVNADQTGWSLLTDSGNGWLFLAGNGSWQYVDDLIPIATSQNWTHFVFANDNNEFKFYLNGSLIRTVAAVDYATAPIKLGVFEYHMGSNTETFDGNIDAVGIWNRALTLGEVSSLYNSGAGIEL